MERVAADAWVYQEPWLEDECGGREGKTQTGNCFRWLLSVARKRLAEN